MSNPTYDEFQAKMGSDIPLSIVASGQNPDGGAHEVIFEDPHGFTFTVPREWVNFDVENVKEDTWIPHTAIQAPDPSELERVWRNSTAVQMMEAEARKRGVEPTYSFEEMDKLGPVESVFDIWKRGGLPEQQGGIGGVAQFADAANQARSRLASSGESTAPQVPLLTGTGFIPKIPKPKGPSIRRKEDIPADAGSGLGNWDQVWDEKRGRWVKDPSLR